MTNEEERGEAQAEEPAKVKESPTPREELEEAQRERGQFREMALRAQADLANYRRRVEEERQEHQSRLSRDYLLKLLPVLDDLQRALEHTPSTLLEGTWLEGIRLIERSLQALLASEGVTTIEAAGQPFDPWEHEAVHSVATDEHQSGTVVSTIRKGYKHQGRVLRPAQVSIASVKKEEPGPRPEEGAPSTGEREA